MRVGEARREQVPHRGVVEGSIEVPQEHGVRPGVPCQGRQCGHVPGPPLRAPEGVVGVHRHELDVAAADRDLGDGLGPGGVGARRAGGGEREP